MCGPWWFPWGTPLWIVPYCHVVVQNRYECIIWAKVSGPVAIPNLELFLTFHSSVELRLGIIFFPTICEVCPKCCNAYLSEMTDSWYSEYSYTKSLWHRHNMNYWLAHFEDSSWCFSNGRDTSSPSPTFHWRWRPAAFVLIYLYLWRLSLSSCSTRSSQAFAYTSSQHGMTNTPCPRCVMSTARLHLRPLRFKGSRQSKYWKWTGNFTRIRMLFFGVFFSWRSRLFNKLISQNSWTIMRKDVHDQINRQSLLSLGIKSRITEDSM